MIIRKSIVTSLASFCILIPAFFAGTCFGQTDSGSKPEPVEVNPYCSLGEDGGILGTCVQLKAYVKNPAAGHVYELRYLIRVPNQRDIQEVILGDETRPSGVCYSARNSNGIPLDQYNRFLISQEVDITRQQLRTLYNLPKLDKFSYVVVRVEAHVYDITAGKYLSEEKTDALLLVANVRKGGYVSALQSMSHFITSHKSCGKEPYIEINRMLKNLDRYDGDYNRIPEAISEVLLAEHFGEEKQLLLLDIVRPDWVHLKNHLQGAIEHLAESGTRKVKEAAKKLLDAQ